MRRSEAFAQYPELRESWPEILSERGNYGEESLNQLVQRVTKWIDEIKQRHPVESVALVGHYFVNLMILCISLGADSRRFRNLGQDVAALSILDIEEGRTSLRLLNDTCHLR